MTFKFTEISRVSWLSTSLALIIASLFSIHACLKHSQKYLDFKIALPGKSWVHLYTSSGGETNPFRYRGIKVNSTGEQVSVRLPLPPAEFDALLVRLDKPGGKVLFTELKVVNGNGELSTRIQSGDIETSASGVLSGSPDRMLLTPTGLSETLDIRVHLRQPFSSDAGLVSVFLKTFLLYGASCLIIAALVRFLVDIYRHQGEVAPLQAAHAACTDRQLPEQYLPFLVAAVFLMIFGARLWLIRTFGSDLPYWDQWDAEATSLYIPYFNGTLSIGDLFTPHNEHRIMLTRLASLGLLIVNGKWDPLLQMTLNAGLYALIGAAVFKTMLTSSRIFWGIFVVIIFSLPFGWQNTLGGFQLQMYLMVGLSLLLLWLMTAAELSLWRWTAGSACALLLLFTMASGFLTCVALAIVSIVAALKRKGPRQYKRLLFTLALCLLVVAAGFLLKTDVPGHMNLQVSSPGGFAVAFAAFLGWPLSLFPILSPQQPLAVAELFFAAMLLWTPFIFFLLNYLKSDAPSEKMTFIIGTGIWVILQTTATAYARGGLLLPPSRYQDMFALGLLVNSAAILFLLKQDHARKTCLIIRILALFWMLGTASGLLRMTEFNLVHDLPSKKSQQQASLEHVKAFVAGGDIKTLEKKPGYDLPYPDKEKLAFLLSNKDIRRSLSSTVTGSIDKGRLRLLTNWLLDGCLFLFLSGLSSYFLYIKLTLPQKSAADKSHCE